MGASFYNPAYNSLTIDGIHTLEAFVEEICDRNNVYQLYFGNILLASSELFQIMKNFDHTCSPCLFSYNQKGALVIGFKLNELFLDVAALFQKEILGLLGKDTLNFSERCCVNVIMCADSLRLNEKQQSVELLFFLNSINSKQAKNRKKLIEAYFNGINDKKSTKKNV